MLLASAPSKVCSYIAKSLLRASPRRSAPAKPKNRRFLLPSLSICDCRFGTSLGSAFNRPRRVVDQPENTSVTRFRRQSLPVGRAEDSHPLIERCRNGSNDSFRSIAAEYVRVFLSFGNVGAHRGLHQRENTKTWQPTHKHSSLGYKPSDDSTISTLEDKSIFRSHPCAGSSAPAPERGGRCCRLPYIPPGCALSRRPGPGRRW